MKVLEVWIEVPRTNGQYQVSNFGHIRLMHRKSKCRKPRDKDRPPIYVGEQRLLFCDFESRRLGWLIRDVGNERGWRFVPRDEMMSQFVNGGIPVDVDVSQDAEATSRMEDANARRTTEAQCLDAEVGSCPPE